MTNVAKVENENTRMKGDRIIVVASFLTMLVVSGSWFSFPAFINSLTNNFNWDRISISTVISVGLIVSGMALPFVGRLVDMFGPKKVIFVANTLLGVSLILKGTITNLWELTVFHGIMGALGYAGGALIANTALISKLVTKRRVLAISLIQSGLPLGQQLFVPLTAYFIIVNGWRLANILLGLICLLLVPIFLFIMKKFELKEPLVFSNNECIERKKPSVLKYMRSKLYLLFICLYFCCGFTDIAIASHIAPFAYGIGISEFISANLFGMIGGFTWIGTIGCGLLNSKLGRENLLLGIYAMRNVSLFLLLYAYNIYTILIFVLLFGLTYFSMVPIISNWLRDTYGYAYLGSLFGTLSLIHAAGASSGTFLYGLLFDIQGNYQQAFILALIVSLVATLCAISIRNVGRSTLKVLRM